MNRAGFGILICITFGGAACEEQAQRHAKAPAPPDFGDAITHVARFDPARGAVVVDVTVKDGFHAYTTGETVGRPLKLTFAETGELRAKGPVVYPKGRTKELPIGRSVIVEGRSEIVAAVECVDGSSIDGKTAQGRFHFQVCTNDACDRPRSSTFEIVARP